MLIPGWLISILTFPGVIVHELGHKFFCDIFKVKVHQVSYFRFGNPAGYVVHEVPSKFYQTFFIDVGPFIVNSLIAIIIFFLSTLVISGTWTWLFFVWLGISIAMNSFPSSNDAKSLWKVSLVHLKSKDLIAIIGLPFSILIYVANLLSIIWFDLLYAVALYLLITRINLGV